MTDHYNNCKHRKISPLATILIFTGLAFFIGSPAFAQSGSSETELRSFRYEEGRTFRMDIPARWISKTPEHGGEIARYSSNEEGNHRVSVYRFMAVSDDAAMRLLEGNKRSFEEAGGTNFVISETTLEFGESLVLESEHSGDEGTRTGYGRAYHMQKGKHVYLVIFSTDNKDMFVLFEQMANSIRMSAS